MVTPEVSQLTFRSRQTGEKFMISMYVSDVVAAKCTFSKFGQAVAASPTYMVFTDDVDLVDISHTVGNTVSVGVYPTSNDEPIPKKNFVLANFLSTIQTRPSISVGWAAGNQISMTQF